jgi:acyl-coenzyme A synthetase/AMP-(fatty) acid ligase
MLPDGLLQYLGRKNFVPEIHGQWVDVDALEQALTASAGVRDAVAAIRQEGDGDPRLIAYIVAEDGARPSVSALRKHVAERVPSALM